MKAKTLVLWSAVALVASISLAEETGPSAIFTKVLAAYESMDTYSAEGTVVSDIDSGPTKINMETTFSIKLKKPNLYLISWAPKSTTQPAFSQPGATWSDGTGAYVYMGGMKAYCKMVTDEMALAGATGISGGAASTIPSLFLTAFKKQPATFSRLVAPNLESDETIEGDDCYVISGSSTISKKETFWISKETHLIRKYARSLEGPEGGVKMPKLTDQQLEEAIKGTGQEVTEERKEAMRAMMKRAETAIKTAALKGTSTELQAKIDSPEFVSGDFRFKLPADAVLKPSLFDGLSNAGLSIGTRQPPAAPRKPEPPKTPPKAGALKPAKTLRTFTAKNDKTVTAEFLSLADGTVKLRRKDGKVIDVPLDKFSDQDRDFIRQQK